jgi:hypothetical protein
MLGEALNVLDVVTTAHVFEDFKKMIMKLFYSEITILVFIQNIRKNALLNALPIFP